MIVKYTPINNYEDTKTYRIQFECDTRQYIINVGAEQETFITLNTIIENIIKIVYEPLF